MKKIISSSLLLLCVSCLDAHAQFVVSDPSVIAAINSQTAVQTAEHIKRLAEVLNTVQLLQSQLTNTQNILQLAQKASEGIDEVGFLSDFRNVVMETDKALDTVKEYIDTAEDLSDQWKNVFGSLDNWMDNAKEVFGSIDMSDKINSSGFTIADSYQQLYQQNSEYAQKFIENSKNVNEKGALKQIAQEMAQLIQMENHTIFLLSQMLKGQSIENSNENLKRKEEIVQFEKENLGVRRFMGIVDTKTFEM
ncbi:MAG: hypothetical protein Q8Q08_09990 [Candidatus Omnitrophota bacterium]|nr:hypothetical protein [Candidatus Omnitrophota bacterium]